MGGFTFALSDSISFLDGPQLISPEIAVALLNDRLNLSDAFIPANGLLISVGDTLSLSDAIGQGRGDIVGDRIQLLDGILIGMNGGPGGFGISIQDSLQFRDVLSSSNTNGPSVADTLALSDSILQFQAYNVLGDALALSDSIVKSIGSIFLNVTVSPTDTLSFADSTTYSQPPTVSLVGDTFQFQDAVFVLLQSVGNSYLRRYLNDV